jgi:hypothetical protein
MFFVHTIYLVSEHIGAKDRILHDAPISHPKTGLFVGSRLAILKSIYEVSKTSNSSSLSIDSSSIHLG